MRVAQIISTKNLTSSEITMMKISERKKKRNRLRMEEAKSCLKVSFITFYNPE